MNEPFTFVSPLSPQDCNQRLENLAKKRYFYFSSGSFILHIKIDSIKASLDCFNLFVSCSPERFRNYAFVFFKLVGQIHPSEKGTTIQLRLQVSKPFSKFDWGFLVFSLLIYAFAFFGVIIGILSSNLWEGLFIGLVVVVAGIGYAWQLYKTYKFGIAKIPDLVYKALLQDLPAKSQGQDSKASDWVSSLSESQ
jgi:hypothetical protein